METVCGRLLSRVRYIVWLVARMRLLFGSGVAKILPMLGHSMGILRLYEILRKVQKHF